MTFSPTPHLVPTPFLLPLPCALDGANAGRNRHTAAYRARLKYSTKLLYEPNAHVPSLRYSGCHAMAGLVPHGVACTSPVAQGGGSGDSYVWSFPSEFLYDTVEPWAWVG